MKKISIILVSTFLLLSTTICTAKTIKNSEQYNQIFTQNNEDGKITAKSIEKAFNENGLTVDVNNNMNSIFEKRYKHTHHKKYNLAIFTNNKIVSKLIKKYPNIGLITPLSMSIYSDDAKKTINISTLSLEGMASITKIPKTDSDLIEYAKVIDIALHKALPNGNYLPLKYDIKSLKSSISKFTTEFELEDGATYKEVKEEFEEEFEGELGPVGFLIPKSYKLNTTDNYDFYDTYSIIRFNAIYPVSKNHPDAGAFAPFSLAIYKKKGENEVHIIYPSIDNWIENLNITEEDTVEAVHKTNGLIKKILQELTE